MNFKALFRAFYILDVNLPVLSLIVSYIVYLRKIKKLTEFGKEVILYSMSMLIA
jgi:hypothetical protein